MTIPSIHPISRLPFAVALALVGGSLPHSQAEAQSARMTPRTAQADTGGAAIQDCARTTVHLTDAGLAFACYDSGNIVRYMFAVDERQFAGRSEMVMDLLERADSAGSASGRARGRLRTLRVRHGQPNARAQAICGQTLGLDGNPPCRTALNVSF